MRNKYFYPIFKLKAKSWIRYWLLKKTEFKGKLSEILVGFSFNLQNTLRQKFVKFEIEGNSIQDGEPSPENEVPIESAGDNVNEFDKENVINAYLNADGTTTSNSTFRVSDYIDVSKFDNITISGNYGGSELNCFYDENKAFVSSFGMGTLTINTKSVPSNAKYVRVTLRRDVLDQYKLEPGTQATPYSPYGMGSMTEKIVNGNLWTSEWEQGYIDANGNLTDSNNHIRTKDFIYFEPEQHYAIKRNIAIDYINIRGYDKNKKFVGTAGNAITLISGSTEANPMIGNKTYCVISTKPGIYYLKFNDASNDLTTQYMMVKGDTPEDYIESEEQTYSIYTQQPFRSIGDVRDVFFKNTVDSPYYDENLTLNDWYERHDIGELILNGSEAGWTKSGNTTVDRFIINTNLYLNDSNSKCNYFKTGILNTTNKGQWFNNLGVQLVFNYTNPGTTTLEQWKTLISTHNLKLIQPLATPLNLLCTTEQTNILENLPITYAGQTNVYSTDVVVPYLEIQYWESDTNG